MKLNVPSYRPCCPNHGEPLEGIPFPMPQKGTGKCPVSGCDFAFEASVDETKVAKDKFGNVTKTADWKVEGDESVLEDQA